MSSLFKKQQIEDIFENNKKSVFNSEDKTNADISQEIKQSIENKLSIFLLSLIKNINFLKKELIYIKEKH